MMMVDSGSTRRPTREAITGAAVELFAERGFDGVSVADLTSAVGVTTRALYRHFPDKRAVLDAVLHDTVVRLVGIARDAYDAQRQGQGDPVVLLREGLAAAVTWSLDHSGLLATYIRERDRSEVPSLRDLEGQLYDYWARSVRLVAPELDVVRIALRQKAVIAALPGLTAQPVSVSRPRLDVMLTDAVVRVCVCPAVTDNEAGAETPRWHPRPSRRDEILASALALWRTPGFHGVGMDDIGRSAGLAGSGLYRYFRDKTEILLDGCERAAARAEVAAERALDGATDPADALRRLTRSYAEIALFDVDLTVVTAREQVVIPEADRNHLLRRQQRTRELWTSTVREWKPELVEPEAHVLVAAALSLMNHMAMASRLIPVSANEAGTLAAALLGLAAES